MNKDLIAIFEYLEREKGIKREIVINAIADSLRAAARKSVKGLGEKVSVEIHPKTGEIEVFTQSMPDLDSQRSSADQHKAFHQRLFG